MCIIINIIESCMGIPHCMTAEEVRVALLDNDHIGIMSEHEFHSCPSAKPDVQKEMKPYWSCIVETATLGGITNEKVGK